MWVSRKLRVDQYNKTKSSAKLSARWFGPFRITKFVAKNAVCLEFPQHIKTHPVVHVSLTKPAISKPSHLLEEILRRAESLHPDTDGKESFLWKKSWLIDEVRHVFNGSP